MTQEFVDYYRCSGEFAEFGISGQLSQEDDYFKFNGAICFGRRRGGGKSRSVTSTLPDISRDVEVSGRQVSLPFDLSAVVNNLRGERYQRHWQKGLEKASSTGAWKDIYYFIRPILSVPVRKHLQRIRLRGWEKIPFPAWPVDFTIETLMRSSMALMLKSSGLPKIPFIWFWPDGAPGCVIVTHDVEGRTGEDFCDQLMDIDDSFGFKAAFQIIPAKCTEESNAVMEQIRKRGFEVNVHDFNHDGYLFSTRKTFLERVAQINQYVRKFGSRGFRAGAMYREQSWFDALEVSYDMSVPNVAHLEPQRGGCCTVMPYFIGDILELPLTTIQDYSLFHILGDYSIALWKKQIDLLIAGNGLVTLLAHPDYLIEKRAEAVYRDLLAHVRQLCEERKLWPALPRDVDSWWRSRNRMTLVQDGGSWRIEGTDNHRARVAYARLENDRVVYELDNAVRG